MAFGVRAFELALMHRMRDLNPARVEDALAEMSATRAELREAHATWTRTAYARRAPKGVGRFRMALGRPAFEGERPIGSLTCDVVRWALPYWRELEFELLVGPGGEIWNQWFVRPSGDRKVSFAGLVPWECVVADVAASFPDAAQEEGSAPHHWAVVLTHDGAAYRARFVYGLLQRVDPIR
ncbi:hypothetical protein ACIBEJ_09440 [Nonomuraea sp. NPDC050790]|uniref:hypothetical protein n=1 Tax=Nonomuraea sp. NPDC050790 TaxID=3364371 RepID=UPI00379D10CC